MSEDEEVDDPLARIIAQADEEDAVLQPVRLDESEFRQRLTALADAAEAVETLAEDAASLRRTGLTESDARDLMYGRNSTLTKTAIDDAFGALDEVAGAGARTRRDLLKRLLADVGDLTQAETEEFLAELRDLHDRYPPENGGESE